MPDPMSDLSTRFLRTPEAARYLSLSGRTLERHRTYGTGQRIEKSAVASSTHWMT